MIATLILYPVPVFAILAIALFPLWFFLPLPLGALFFVPHILLSRSILKRLENSGTSRVAAIERAIRDSVWLGFGGIIYFVGFWLISLAADRFASDVPSL
ncbi:MAG TPA: hypothetical protein VK961_13425 [Chthoniobacter sp.]|nr:hypothetical protein [Chthoniobacter sp.]